jgi:hypothetical protein
MNQTDIFDPPSRPVDTSQAAARVIAPAAGRIREQVYAAIVSRGGKGATRKELEGMTGMPAQSLTGRLWELEGKPRDGWGRRPFAPRVAMTTLKRDGCRVYVALSQMGAE